MGKRFIDKGAVVDGGVSQKVSIDLPVDMYAGLGLVIEGTTDTGQTLAPSDVGNIRIERLGEQIMSESFEFFHELTKMKFGKPTATLPAAGATRIFAFIPFFYLQPNVLDVKSKDEVDVFIDFGSNLPTRFGSNSVTYTLIGSTSRSVPMEYLPKIRQQDIVASSAGSNPKTLDAKNVAVLFLEDSADKFDSVTVEVDDRTVYNNLDDDILNDFSNIENLIESSALTLTEVAIAESSLLEAVNNEVVVTPTANASGTLKVTILTVDQVDPSSSIAKVNAFQQQQRAKAEKIRAQRIA